MDTTTLPDPQSWGIVEEVGTLFPTPFPQAHILSVALRGLQYLTHLLIKSTNLADSLTEEA